MSLSSYVTYLSRAEGQKRCVSNRAEPRTHAWEPSPHTRIYTHPTILSTFLCRASPAALLSGATGCSRSLFRNKKKRVCHECRTRGGVGGGMLRASGVSTIFFRLQFLSARRGAGKDFFQRKSKSAIFARACLLHLVGDSAPGNPRHGRKRSRRRGWWSRRTQHSS